MTRVRLYENDKRIDLTNANISVCSGKIVEKNCYYNYFDVEGPVKKIFLERDGITQTIEMEHI